MENFKAIGFKLDQQDNDSKKNGPKSTLLSSPATRYLYYNKHKIHTDLAYYNDKILFVTNIPPYLTEQHIKTVFTCFGKIDHVLINLKPNKNNLQSSKLSKNKNYFKSKQNDVVSSFIDDDDDDSNIKEGGYKDAYVLFNQEDSIDKALSKKLTNEKCINLVASNLNIGFKKWVDQYKSRFVDARSLQKEIDEFMEEYDKNKELKEKEELEKTNEPDEDGWVTVTAKSRKSNLPMTQRNIEKLKTKQKKKQQKMQLINFYAFQMKDSKKEYISQLRKRFDDDKKRIESMKQNRKFKPF